MPRSLGDHLFTFAVISDSHVNEAEDRSASPFASNRLANARFRYVVASVNRHRPAFTVHLGDMGNPLPELSTYERAAENFGAIAGSLESPLHLVAGNHCVGDKPGGWVPVPRVCEESLAQYERCYGRCTYSFDHEGCHFAILNSLLVNSELEAERAQRRWLDEDLRQAAGGGQRLFVMMHYPPYIAARGEPGSYDNLDEPGRSWLLGVFERFGVEAVYTGHVHNYFYNRVATTHLYTLPATSFVRQDYSELFRVQPADAEGGRDDRVKLGYFLVRIHEHGHANELIRTCGRTLGEGETMEGTGLREMGRLRSSVPSTLGTEMRDNWLSREVLRPNNSVSPFTRRLARNDWAILALQEMGVSKVRLTLQELVKEDVRERMAPLADAGFEFVVYSHGIPGDSEYGVIRQHRALLAGWELMLAPGEMEVVATRMLRGAGGLVGDPALPCYLDEVRDLSAADIGDANVKHVANYGFQLTDSELIERLSAADALRRVFGGLVFRLRRRGEPELELWSSIGRIGELARTSGMRHQVHILFSGNVTAERFEDDLATANRVAESTLAAWLAGNLDLYFDTFEDIDRGYFVRHGLVDRRYNPRLPARVLRHLTACLEGIAEREAGLERFEVTEIDHGRVVSGPVGSSGLWLVLPRPGCRLTEIISVGAALGVEHPLVLTNLDTGAVSDLAVERSGSKNRLREPLATESPSLVTT